MMDSKFSILPTEIVILICDEACRISPTFCLSLSQTSTWTRRLAMPHLYSTVIITKLRTAYSIPSILQPPAAVLSDPSLAPASHVRNLWIGPVSKKTVDIFTLCENVSHLAVPEDNFYWLIHSSSQGNPDSGVTSAIIASKPDIELFILNTRKPIWHVRQLVPVPPELPSPLFGKIRRLWIGKTGGYDSGGLHFPHFTRLTHIAVPYHNPSIQRLPSILHLLEHPSIVCLVLILLTDLLEEEAYDDGLRWVVETRKLQPKLLALPFRHESLRTHWEEGLCPGQSVWEKAVIFTNFLNISRSGPAAERSSHSN
ncbi:hypothetical protein D9619_012716 [Psilocybe cf. subviscida]|uniref:Uncharacterized protein n=1 Tax=Psilocybe cf. subviscida TaxID=2480587 RepID=A0A8H5ER20_9AGAR|nr:hypothetical protein D9619_012716 [Psilocybe cf. subviscida]